MVIKEAFDNLAQAAAENRATVANLTDSNISFTAQVAEYAKNLLVKESEMAALHKTFSNLQGEINNPEVKLN